MTLGLWEERGRQRRKRRVWWTVVRWAFVLAIIVGAGVWSYDIGTTLARQDVIHLERRIAEINEVNARLRTQIAGLEAAVRTASERAARLTGDIPSAEDQELLNLVREKLEEGVPRERLAFVIVAADVERECPVDPVTKRFVVRTELHDGGNESVSFADNTITVTASGELARNETGQAEAWFDPAKPVTAVFTHIGGQRSEAKGSLPLRHSVVVGDTEYRFNLVAGERSFVRVTADGCIYP